MNDDQNGVRQELFKLLTENDTARNEYITNILQNGNNYTNHL
jgi:hypothetical protein